jgi:tungstate transport system substrate-binding protein
MAFRRPVVGIALASALVTVVLTPGVSHADDSSTLTIVGTSDVSDSNLVAAVLKPGFEAAYPGITLNYVPQGTGPAITTAESGAASALIVHAASLENQFVANGYSEEQYGRAIFYGDYVLLGPPADPAGVMSGGAPSNDIVTAFEKIAAAGAAGKANFVSRGGTPGTTVEEHAIWTLTSGVATCNVSDANGGGTSPSTTSGDCPASIPYPDWYHATGAAQAANIENADVCNYSGGNCYTLTDRGTYQYLVSTNAISKLQIVARNNSASARGGSTLLVNSFHAYAINPAKFANDPNVHLNLTAAEDFLNWVTSPAAQQQVASFEADQPEGAPFLPDAAPVLTVSPQAPKHVIAGDPVTVKGTLTNVVAGTPPLAGVQVSLNSTTGDHQTALDTSTTSAKGHFTLRYHPTTAARLAVSTPQISQIEVTFPAPNPPYGDILVPTSAPAGSFALKSAITLASPTVKQGVVQLRGSLDPKVMGKQAALRIYADPVTGKTPRAHTLVATRALAAGARRYHVQLNLATGKKWAIRVGYVNPGVAAAGRSKTRTLLV